MAIDYVFEGTPPSAVPHDPATGLDNASNVFYVSSKKAGWVFLIDFCFENAERIAWELLEVEGVIQ